MYKHLIALLLIFAFAVSAADKIPAIYTSREDFVKAVGHIQGGCVSKDAIYLSHMKGIFKFDHKGKLIKHASTVSHTGDLCYYDGKIYATIAYYDKERKAKELVEKMFDPNHISYERFNSSIVKSNNLFDIQVGIAKKMAEMDTDDNPFIVKEMETKLQTLQTFIDKMEDLTSELVIHLSSNKKDNEDINNLFKDMDDLIDSVKDY